jgi:tRNA (cytidine/uridine-2'-O-)-methyltransferase
MDDRSLKRAGLDYWSEVDLHRHVDLDELYMALPDSRFIYFTTKASRSYADFEYKSNDCLIFGPETRGLPESVLKANEDRCRTIPMRNPAVRSLNLSNSVAIVLYHALNRASW